MANVTPVLNEISGALSSLATQIQAQFPDYPSFAEHWNWQQPGATKYDLIDRINKTISLINLTERQDIDENLLNRFSKIPATIAYIIGNTLPNMPGGNSYMGYGSIVSMLEAIEALLDPLLPTEPDWQQIQDQGLIPAQLKKRLDQTSRGISNVEKQLGNASEKMKVISEAYQAALDLPASLAGLDEAKGEYENSQKQVRTVAQSIEKGCKANRWI